MGQAHELKQIEESIKASKTSIKLRVALDKLRTSANWKLLIEEEYFIQEAARLVSAKSNMSLQTDEQQKFIDTAITGIGALQQFFNKIYAMGEEAEKNLTADRETYDEILEEEED